jgi:anhydro-N-acetylmuramic acid kinase
MKNPSIIVAGVMSGTSADGINVALVRLGDPRTLRAHTSGSQGREPVLSLPKGLRRHASFTRFELLGHAEFPYSSKVRAAVLAAMNAPQASVGDLARLNSLLGELYADAVIATQTKFKLRADLVGCHGQTLFHQGERATFLGRKVTATWQTGEGAVIAARVGAPVVSDFRQADMAAGGKGAPLVPYLDYLLFRDSIKGRIVQNIGGIANLTVIPAGATSREVFAFDTGPGNMVIDAVTQKLFNKQFDRGGKIAAAGSPIDPVVHEILRSTFFRRRPPKTAGREEFGREFVSEFLRLCSRARKQDVVSTATALTARSISSAIERFVLKSSKRSKFSELVLSGGGAKNSTLLRMLTRELAQFGVRVRLSDDFGLPSEAKEAAAFAVMAYETWHRRPSNIPSATGAKRPAVLGKISYV